MSRLLPLVLLVLLGSVIRLDPALAEGGSRISLDDEERPLSASSGSSSAAPVMDDAGSMVAFESLARAAGDDANNVSDVLIRFLEAGTNELISTTPDGRAGNGASTSPSMTGAGELVAFQSLASDLTEGDTNGVADVFLRDRISGSTRLLSSTPDGVAANASSFAATINRSGNVIVFCSLASNLAEGDDNGRADAFIINLSGSALSRVPPPADGSGCARTAISADGSVVVLSYTNEDPDGAGQVYRHDIGTGDVKMVSAAGGAEGNDGSGMSGLAINADGSLIAFDSAASNLVDGDNNNSSDVFLWSEADGSVTRLSQNGDGTEGNSHSGSLGLTLSADGNWVAFSSLADNLLPGDANFAADVFRLDRQSGTLTLVSADTSDRSANGTSYSPSISPDGTAVAFTSLANNIVINDRNGNPDIFLRTGSFPEVAGTGEVPSASPGEPAVPLPSGDDDGDGLPGWVMVAFAALAILGALGGAWYLLGRKPAA